ncbi:MAG TPA: choice-of-anchor D domain-containing protein [Acidimicrobiales bacterium]|nr:choice-of-anchor D domain-containing protein [Acidimicrobiales bacterium]
MSDSSKPGFFSTLPGLLTGMAGILTAGTAVAGLAVQQGWVGGGSDSSKSDTPAETSQRPGSSGSGGTSSSGGASSSGARAAGSFEVSPGSVEFDPVGAKQATVTVRNTGDVALSVKPPQVTGEDADRFRATNRSCTGSLDPGRRCELQVSFDPKAGKYNAVLVVSATGAPNSAEVPLEASALL